jgi:hypothetical protein
LDIISYQWAHYSKVKIFFLIIKKNFFLFFRYSHSADIINDTLWLLGGMNANERRPPGLCKINLISGDVFEYAIPVLGCIKIV